MKNSFLLVILFFISAAAGHGQGNDSLFLNAAITKLLHSKEYTLKVANLMPEAKYSFKPVKGEMSFGEHATDETWGYFIQCGYFSNAMPSLFSAS